MSMVGISFDQMTRPELDLALDWAASEGWNPGLDDAEAFYATDPQGFFVARDAGQPVAAISVVNQSDDLAFLGLYLCLPAYRGQGIGYGLWQHALAHAGDRVVGLDGVPDQQDNYRKSGFELVSQTYRFAGPLTGAPSDSVHPVEPGDLDALIALDTQANGYAKPAFLINWLQDSETRKTVVLGTPARGFATIRACRAGHKIGPVIAATLDDAEALIRAAAHAAGAVEAIIDVPDDCSPLMEFCRAQGLEVSFNTARMYRGTAPEPGAALRTVATMELG